ncbi:MAG: glycosyltransferase family 4 protein [Lentisphaeria bacterium]|nr:glycosyltransferase family 4 protein [Lentisphaeria bacterium]
MSKTPLTIAFLVSGSGNTFYCENCLRDCAAVKALRARGHDVILVPLYLPLFADEEALAGETPVFFGGITVYLQQKFALFRKAPRWFDRLLNTRWILKWAARKAGSTRAYGMGQMTMSMLEGTAGAQAKEVARLADWLADLAPDVIHFSNALLLGAAPALKRRVPDAGIVCSLQDEDTWLDALDPPYDQTCLAKVGELARQCDAVVSVSPAYARQMGQRLALAETTLRVVEPGLDVDRYPAGEPSQSPRRIGFLSRISEKLGAGILVEAFIQLAGEPGFEDLEVVFGGGMTGDDTGFVRRLKKRLRKMKLEGRVQFAPGLTFEERLGLIKQLTVMCVPMSQGEAFGVFALESLLCGVPVVQPDAGGFRDLLRATGGGLLYDAESAAEPAASLRRVLNDPRLCRQLGQTGRRKAADLYSSNREAEKLEKVYRETRTR